MKPENKTRWTDIYINGLQDNIKLFGSTINNLPRFIGKSHVQSYIFSMDKQTLEHLIDWEIFSMTNYPKTFYDAIWNREVMMSRRILDNGWNIGCLHQYYKDIDFTFKTANRPITLLDDIMYDSHRNVSWTEYELVFIKGNRVKIPLN